MWLWRSTVHDFEPLHRHCTHRLIKLLGSIKITLGLRGAMSKITAAGTLGGGVLLAPLAYLGWGRGGLQGAGSSGVGLGEELVPGGLP